MNNLELRTKRLILRTLDQTYVQQELDYQLRNEDFFREWLPLRHKQENTLDYQLRKLKSEQKKTKTGTFLKLRLFKAQEPYMNIIGDITFSNIMRGNSQYCFLGYKLDSKQTGMGYMYEALQKAIEYAFDELNLHRIEANIMPRNESSLKLIKKLAFNYEGIAIKLLKINGEWEDHLRFSLINSSFIS